MTKAKYIGKHYGKGIACDYGIYSECEKKF